MAEARAIQDALRPKLILTNDFGAINTIAGVDVGYDNERGLAHASIVMMHMNELKTIHAIQHFMPVDFPYIPGLLSFREIPAIVAALAQLPFMPDLLMVDGQGIAHPKGLGIAAHLGIILNIPSLGVAKSRLTGSFTMPGPHKGDLSPLIYKHKRIGTVLRSRYNVKPLFISPGHRLDVETALSITLRCLTRYRLPEPTRLADKLSKCKPGTQGSLTSL